MNISKVKVSVIQKKRLLRKVNETLSKRYGNLEGGYKLNKLRTRTLGFNSTRAILQKKIEMKSQKKLTIIKSSNN